MEEPASFPLEEDKRQTTFNILNANEVLREGLQQYLGLRKEDLDVYLNKIRRENRTFKDEYDVEIRSYSKVFKFIWEQYNETLCENYAIKQFENDKLDLCSVARFLSHQKEVKDRGNIIMKRMGDALGYRCHPCTPYKRKQYDQNMVPNTDHISPEGVPLEERLVLCKNNDHHGELVVSSSAAPTTTVPSITSLPTISTSEAPGITTAVELIKPINSSSESDFEPCNHSNGDVVCDQIPLKEIQKLFKRTSLQRLASVKLILQPYIFSETFIPQDVFGEKRILNIRIEYPFQALVNRSLSLEVDPNAFRSTKSYTNTFTINIIDCTLLNLNFLSGFDRLTDLVFSNIYNIKHCLPSLPLLPGLKKLHVEYCAGMNELSIFPTLKNGLNDVKFIGDVDGIRRGFNNETVDRVIDWLLLSSANTLEELGIMYMNQVTKVPHKIASFKALRALLWYGNDISSIKSGSFSFSVPVSQLAIIENGINEIEPGAFQGDFKDAVVYVYSNNLTRFEESVFGPMLQQMDSGKGFINAGANAGINPIDCSEGSICHLAWLRRYEVNAKFYLKCSNGTSFKDLQPAGFNHCP